MLRAGSATEACLSAAAAPPSAPRRPAGQSPALGPWSFSSRVEPRAGGTLPASALCPPPGPCESPGTRLAAPMGKRFPPAAGEPLAARPGEDGGPAVAMHLLRGQGCRACDKTGYLPAIRGLPSLMHRWGHSEVRDWHQAAPLTASQPHSCTSRGRPRFKEKEPRPGLCRAKSTTGSPASGPRPLLPPAQEKHVHPPVPRGETRSTRRGLPESWEQLKPVSPVLLLCPRGCPPAMSAVRCGDRPRSERQSRL